MKTIDRTLLHTIIALVCLCSQVVAEHDEAAFEIMQRNDQAEGFEAAYSHFYQTILTSSGAKRTLEIRAWIVDSGDKQLAEYLAPADIRGQKILMTEDGDNIWMFNPETRRTRKLGSHMKKKKVMGSDFTYEDQSGGKLVEKYNGAKVGEEELDGESCVVLDLFPTPKGPSYTKVRAWVSTTDYVARRIDYFENDEDQPFKRLVMSDIREVECQSEQGTETKITPFRMVMTNLGDHTETVNVTDTIQFGVDIPESIFNPRNLDR